MSEAELTTKGGAGVNPSFTATGIFPSGLNSSGVVATGSGFFKSGLEASALIKGTIGQFLATALGGSGFDASGPSKFTTMSGTDLEISTINGAPPATTTSTFTSGLTTCALMSVGASMVADASAVFLSAVNMSGQLAVGTSILASGDLNVSQATVRGLLSVAGSVLGQSGATFSGLVSATSFAGQFAFTSVDAPSGGTFSALVSANSILVACTLAVSGLTSLGASLTVASAIYTCGAIQIGSTGFLLIDSIAATTRLGTLVSVNASATFQSGLNTSAGAGAALGGQLSVLATAFFQSGFYTSGNITIIPPSTVQSAGGLALISIGFQTGAQTSYIIFASVGSVGQVFALTTSGTLCVPALNALSITVSTINGSPPGTTTSTFSSGLTTCALMSVGASMIVDGTASFGASAIFESGINMSGTNTEVSALVACTLAVSGLTSLGGSVVAASGINTSGPVLAGTTMSVTGSAAFTSTTTYSGGTVFIPGSQFASAGSAVISIGFQTGAQTSYIMFASVGSVGQVFALTTSGVLSTNAVNALSITVSTINGAPPITGNSITLPSGLTACAIASFGGSVIVTCGLNVSGIIQGGTSLILSGDINASQATVRGLLSVGGSILGQSGATFSGLVSATSFVGAFTLTSATAQSGGTWSALGSFGASILVQSGIQTSGQLIMTPGSGPSGVQLVCIAIISGAQGSHVMYISIANINAIFAINYSGFTSIGQLETSTASIPVILGNTSFGTSVTVQSFLGVIGQMTLSGNVSFIFNGNEFIMKAGLQLITIGNTTSFTLNATDRPYHLLDTSTAGSAIVVQLPSAATATGAIVWLTKIDGTTNSVVVAAASGDTVEGLSQINANSKFSKFWMINDGSVTWHDLGSGMIASTFSSGGTFSALVSANSILVACTLAVSGLTSLGGSLAAASGINTSGTIAGGTIISAGTSLGATSGGDFSGVVALAPPSTAASAGGLAALSVIFATGAQTSYVMNASVGATNVFVLTTSGVLCVPALNALSITVSTINGSPPGTTTSTFTSGLTTCALASIGASMIVDGTASFGASVTFESIVNISGQTTLASIIVESGINLSATIQGTTASFTAVTGSSYTGASGLFQSGLNQSALIVMNPGSQFASAGSALMSIGFASGAQTSYVMFVSVGSVGQVFALTTCGVVSANAVAMSTGGAGGLFSVGGPLSVVGSGTFGSGITVSGLISAGGSILGQSGATFSGLVSATSFAGAFAFTSADAASGGTFSALFSGVSGLFACTLAVSGLASFGQTNISQIGVTASATFNGNTSFLGASVYITCGLFTSGDMYIEPPSTAFSAGGCALLLFGLPTGAQASYWMYASVGNNPMFAFNLSNIFSILAINVSTINGSPPGTTTSTFTSGLTTCALMSVGASMIVDGTASFGASAVFESGINTSGTDNQASILVACTLAVSGITSLGGSVAATSGINTSGPVLVGTTMSVTGSATFTSTTTHSGGIVFAPGSQFASAGSAVISIGFQTGAQTSYIIFASLGTAGLIFALDTSGRVTLGGTLSALSGAFQSGLNTSGGIAVQGTTHFQGAGGVSFGNNVTFTSFIEVSGGINVSQTMRVGTTMSATSGVITSNLLVSGNTNLGGGLRFGGLLIASVTISLGVSNYAVFTSFTTSLTGSAVVVLPFASAASGQEVLIIMKGGASALISTQAGDGIGTTSNLLLSSSFVNTRLFAGGGSVWYNITISLI